MNQKVLLSSGGLLLAVGLFLAVNIISNTAFKSTRLDLTDNKFYTLSQGTRNIVSNLKEPISLKLYLSQKLAPTLASINTYTIRVKELLEEYKRASSGKISLQFIDPEPFSEEEDKAVANGLQGAPIEGENTTFYFGLVGTNSTDGEAVLPFFNPNREEFLEYDITQLIYKLDNPKQKVVGIMSTLPIQGKGGSPFVKTAESNQPLMIIDQIKQLFQVRKIETTVDKIPDDIDVLMLVHPKGFTDKTLFALDQFVLKGGRLLAFVDPYAETDEPPADPNNPLASLNAPRHSDLKKLLDTWGVEIVENKAVGDLSLAKKVQMQKGSKGLVIEYPVWIDLHEKNFNNQDIITAKLDSIALATAGSLKKKEGAEITVTPLLETSEQASLIDSSKLGMFADVEEMVRSYKPENKFTLAARLTGKLKTAFPDGKPKDDKAKEEKPSTPEESLKESKEDANIILVADTDILDDKFWVRVQNFLGQRIALPMAANDKFVTNALDNLTGSNDLISVRNRGTLSRPFTKVEEIRQNAELKFREKEKQLLAQLQETEKKLNELQHNRKEGSNAQVLTTEQQQEITRFRDEKLKIRKELRAVQHELQKDIERLDSNLKWINIGLIPFLVAIGGILLGFYRNRRKRELSAA
ncbi:MAG: hypothetical protein RIT27_1754 [Pseudomonadota bacterium]|jgi:ABC-type uncharacterized transport system involved in gliding motility auxiliary subunit